MSGQVTMGSGLDPWQHGLGLDDESNRPILVVEQFGLNDDRTTPDVHRLCRCSYQA